jgi:hypothetical protein
MVSWADPQNGVAAARAEDARAAHARRSRTLFMISGLEPVRADGSEGSCLATVPLRCARGGGQQMALPRGFLPTSSTPAGWADCY